MHASKLTPGLKKCASNKSLVHKIHKYAAYAECYSKSKKFRAV